MRRVVTRRNFFCSINRIAPAGRHAIETLARDGRPCHRRYFRSDGWPEQFVLDPLTDRDDSSRDSGRHFRWKQGVPGMSRADF